MSKTTYYFAVLWTFILTAIATGQQWVWQQPQPQGNDLFDIEMLDNNTGWAVGAGVVLYTANQGDDWSVREIGRTASFLRVKFLDPQTGFILGQEEMDGQIGSVLASTTDGGYTWAFTDFPRRKLWDVVFLTEQVGILAGDSTILPSSSIILRTSDGGQSWTSTNFGTVSLGLTWLRFINETTGWAGGGKILYTSDGGQTWELRDEETLFMPDARFFDSDNGVAISSTNFLRTIDGGTSWMFVSGLPFTPQFLNFMDQTNGWVGGEDGQLAYTSDAGETWQYRAVETGDYLIAGEFESLNSGWICGENGYIHRTTDFGLTWDLPAGGRITPFDLTHVSFVDTLHGWASGGGFPGGSAILHTRDGGENWTIARYDTLAASALGGVYAITDDIVWAMTTTGEIYYTQDGGDTWAEQDFEGFAQGPFQFLNPDTGWVLCNHGLARTHDGGNTWTYFEGGFPAFSVSMFFVDADYGWVGGGKTAYIAKTTNGGANWEIQLQQDASDECYWDVYFTDRLNGWAVGWYNLIYHTTDGGATWMGIGVGASAPFRHVQFTDDQHGWVMSDTNGETFYTTDGGVHWNRAATPVRDEMNNMSFADSRHGWAVGKDGTILRWDAGSLPITEITRANLPSDYDLSAYPNPFNPVTTLSYSIPQTGRIQIAVYDITGRLVQTLADRILPAGSYSQPFNASHLPSGIYVVRLQGDKSFATGKLILLK